MQALRRSDVMLPSATRSVVIARMKKVHVIVISSLVGASGNACTYGDDLAGCDPYVLSYSYNGCVAAQTALMMDSPSFLAQPDDVARYFKRMRLVIAAEPYLMRATPIRQFAFNTLATTDANVAMTWRTTRKLALGNGADPAIQEAGMAFYDEVGNPDTPINLPFMVHVRGMRLYNPHQLNARLAPYQIAVFEPKEWLGVDHSNEGTFFHWPSDAGPTGNDTATATIDIDISPGLFPAYKFRAIVSPTAAEVFYVSQNIPPDQLDQLAPTTQPWPL